MSGVKGTPKDKQKWKKMKPYLKLMASVHLNIDYGVSVLGGPLSLMQVSWAASKFKATSYYSVHPIILSATHMIYKFFFASFPFGLVPKLKRGVGDWATLSHRVPDESGLNKR